MYQYTETDRAFVATRARQYRAQVERRLQGGLTEDEFRPLRLQNGLYLVLHAYMMRIAIPYGTLNARQLRGLADITDRFDRGYGHFTTRQNLQINWPKLVDTPDILDALAGLDMHAVQTSGSCVRAVTADHLAGAAPDESADPRPTAELIRQWSSDHPEFAFLPRKFKIAVTGSERDRAATLFHDIGVRLVRNETGAPGYQISVGGGLGRTPMIGKVLRAFLPEADLLGYIDAILHAYNLIGRRDNKYKARIKITVHEHGLEAIREAVEARFRVLAGAYPGTLRELARIAADFAPPVFLADAGADTGIEAARNPLLRAFVDTNVARHRHPGYVSVTVALKAHGTTPGDATSAQMRALADIAEEWAHDDLRVSHEQNIILPHVPRRNLAKVHAALARAGLATANAGLISDMIACPGMDYCDLATARSIPVAKAIARRFEALKIEHEIGPLRLKISGCVNACGHHHIGHIGILGLEKGGVESYQITLGGDGRETAAIGQTIGPGFSAQAIVPAVETIIATYLALRLSPDEAFLEAYQRLGPAPFQGALYDTGVTSDAA